MPAFNPTAEDGFDFWTKLEYGEYAAPAEKAERRFSAKQIMDCHANLAGFTQAVRQPELFMVINEACEQMLNAVAHLLYLDKEIILHTLVGVGIVERNKLIDEYVERVRPSQPSE